MLRSMVRCALLLISLIWVDCVPLPWSHPFFRYLDSCVSPFLLSFAAARAASVHLHGE